MNGGHAAKPLDGKENSDKNNSKCASKELDYGCEDLPIFGKKGGLPCVLVKGMAHVVKGIMEY
jgi:hypothetical protein